MSTSGFRWDRPFTRDDLKAVYDDYIRQNQVAVSFLSWMRRSIPDEGYYQGKILEWLKAEQRSGRIPRIFFYKTASGPYMRRGLPDIQCCIDGEYWCFEVKRPIVGAASDLQLQTAEEIKSAGGHCFMVSFVEEVEHLLRKWLIG